MKSETSIKPITLSNKSKDYSVDDNSGEVIINGIAEPNETLTIKSDKKTDDINDEITTDKKGNFKFTEFYFGGNNVDCTIQYKDKELKNKKAFLTIIYSERYFKNHSSNYIDNENKINNSNNKNKDITSTNHTPKVTSEDKAALRKAVDYSDTMHMSKQGIYDQLTSQAGEGFTPDQANYAIQNLDK